MAASPRIIVVRGGLASLSAVTRALLLATTFLMSACSIPLAHAAQAGGILLRPAMSISQEEFFGHMTAPKSTLTSLLPKGPYDFYIAVTIGEDGHYAAIIPDTSCSRDQGCAEICRKLQTQTFKPFENNGMPIRAVATLHFSSGQKN